MYLRLYSLTNHGCNRIGVARQSMDIGFSPHIPDASCGIPAACNENVYSRMQGHAVDGAKMTMIVTDHLQENLDVYISEIKEGRKRKIKINTLLYSKSQHFTCRSSPALKRYGCRGLTWRALTVLTWPVNDNFNFPLAKSQISRRGYVKILYYLYLNFVFWLL